MIICDKFGFLPISLDIECSGMKICCVDDFDNSMKVISKFANKDGFIYPPTIYHARHTPNNKRKYKRIPNTERPAFLYKLPPSHKIEFESDSQVNKDELRCGIFGFLKNLVGYIYGIRLQFHDWWFDGRIPFKSQHQSYVNKKQLVTFLDHSMKQFASIDKEKKKRIINILYMHNRSPIYEWDWERFVIEYMVFDACWDFSGLKTTRTPHKERIIQVCTEYGLYQDKDVIRKIVDLRNNLFHESLWCGESPCTAANNDDFFVSYHLRRLNQRLILAILGYNSNYVKSNWTCTGRFMFD
jgi:hypothetical protein